MGVAIAFVRAMLLIVFGTADAEKCPWCSTFFPVPAAGYADIVLAVWYMSMLLAMRCSQPKGPEAGPAPPAPPLSPASPPHGGAAEGIKSGHESDAATGAVSTQGPKSNPVHAASPQARRSPSHHAERFKAIAAARQERKGLSHSNALSPQQHWPRPTTC